MSLPPLQHIEAQDPKFFALRRRILLMFGGWFVLALVFLVTIGIIFTLFTTLFVLSGIIMYTQLTLYHKTQIENFHHYRQIEALFSLYKLIEPQSPLPPLRLWVISPDFALLLAETIQQQRPRLIVELGSGASTLISAYALKRLGASQVISFEHSQQFTLETQRNLEKHGLTEYAQVIHAPLTENRIGDNTWQWYDRLKMEEVNGIDLLIVDGPPDSTGKLARFPAVPALFDQLNNGALILVDDYLRQDEHTIVNRWLGEFHLEVVETRANEKGAAVLRKVSTRP